MNKTNRITAMQNSSTITKTKWILDAANSQIGFTAKQLMFSKVRGSFLEFDASIYTEGKDFLTTVIDVWLNPASIDTGNEQRDDHLKDVAFFDITHFKIIHFAAHRMLPINNHGHYILLGDLTIKGIKKPVSLEVESGGRMKDPWGKERALFNVNGKINRKEWDLNWNAALETGGVLLSEEVWINCEVQLIRGE
jgi:polyisoprenoid-binding protein YceI